MSEPREPVALDPTKLVVAQATDPGKVRAENQDALSVQKNVTGERLFVVADGMGGQRGGETASKLCIDTLARAFRDPHGKPEERLRRGLELANEEVYSHALSNPEHKGMGTTAVALLFAHGPGQIWLAWVGDSRCYRLRDGALEALTRDHTLMAEWIGIGVLKPQEAENHPRRHELTRAIGQAPDVSVEIAAVDARPGDRFLLCSDGLHAPVPERALKATLAGSPPEEAAKQLVERANANGGPDNIALLVIEVPADAVTAAEVPAPEVALEFALPSPPPPPAPPPEPEPAPAVEPPGDEFQLEATAHTSAAIDAAIAELSAGRSDTELAPASERDLPPELALGMSGTKLEFIGLKAPDEAYELSEPESAPPAAAPAPPKPAPAAAAAEPPARIAQTAEESFADLMDDGGATEPELAPLPGLATPPSDSLGAPAFGAPSLVAPPPSRAVQIPLMTPVRKRRGLHAPSLLAGLAAGAVVAVLGAAAWLYTGMSHSTGSATARAPVPAPAQLARPAPAPHPVAPPQPAPAPAPAPALAPPPPAAPAPAPARPEPARVPAPAPPTAAVVPAPAPSPVFVPAPGPAPAPTTVVIVRPSQPPQPSAPPAAPDGSAVPAAPKLPTSSAFELSAPVHRFVDEWLRAQETHDAPLFSSLGFRELPTELAGTWTTRDAYHLVAASVDEERSTPETVYLRLVVSYAFKDASGRFRTEDEERLILRNDAGTLRYEGRWSK